MSLHETIKIWKCDACGKTGRWEATWRHRTYLHEKGMWDEQIQVCSARCQAVIDRKKSSKNRKKK